MKTNICPVCVSVSSVWLLLSIGVAWGVLAPQAFLLPIAFLMGGSVVGIAYLGEKKFRFASEHPQKWKTIVILIGMPLSYFLLTNLSKPVVFLEILLLIPIAYFYFFRQPTASSHYRENKAIRDIEEKMKDCC